MLPAAFSGFLCTVVEAIKLGGPLAGRNQGVRAVVYCSKASVASPQHHKGSKEKELAVTWSQPFNLSLCVRSAMVRAAHQGYNDSNDGRWVCQISSEGDGVTFGA